jgi:hypothetical protein
VGWCLYPVLAWSRAKWPEAVKRAWMRRRPLRSEGAHGCEPGAGVYVNCLTFREAWCCRRRESGGSGPPTHLCVPQSARDDRQRREPACTIQRTNALPARKSAHLWQTMINLGCKSAGAGSSPWRRTSIEAQADIASVPGPLCVQRTTHEPLCRRSARRPAASDLSQRRRNASRALSPRLPPNHDCVSHHTVLHRCPGPGVEQPTIEQVGGLTWPDHRARSDRRGRTAA